jgi:putative CocE/NonD family hydrolase
MMRSARTVLLVLAIAAQQLAADAQNFAFEPPAAATDTSLPPVIRDLAERLLPAYQEDDPDRYFSTLAALQMAVGEAAAAHTTRLTLRERLQTEQSPEPASRVLVYDIYTQARAIEATDSIPFVDAYRRAFQETMNGIDDRTAYALEDWFAVPAERPRAELQQALDARRDAASVTLEEGLELVQAWFAFDAYRSLEGVAGPLLAEDSERRYVIEEVAIPAANGAPVAAALIRPRAATAAGELPTVLEFTLDRTSIDAREAAAHGYASVLALARIAGDPQFRPRAPFESDGDDARAAIEWIAKQSWSDGRVAMQGTGYGGFVAWSAAKKLPPALRALATSDPMAPGIDWPNPNGIYVNAAYRWVYGVLARPNDALVRDDAGWRAIDEEWYRSGMRYRDLPALPGRASAVFRSWLNHPSYDRFWQKWLPFDAEFAAVDIPVLTITGYYSAGATGALHYFTQHHEHDSGAEHALLIGPFDTRAVEHGSPSSREGSIDPAADIDPRGVRYAWFDHVLREAERPSIVSANVNYELAGANEWRHEQSLAALEARPLRFYLAGAQDGAPQRLAPEKAALPLSLTYTVDLRDRADAGWRPTPSLVVAQVEPRDGEAFVSEPLAEPVELAGRLRGELDFTINKYDVDLRLMLYELTADGEYVKLFEPAYTFRASYSADRVHRRLLLAGVRQQLPFQTERLMGRVLQRGSRLVMTLGVNRRADQQINYGAGNDVGEESIEDAGAPLRIRWHEGSFIELPSQP